MTPAQLVFGGMRFFYWVVFSSAGLALIASTFVVGSTHAEWFESIESPMPVIVALIVGVGAWIGAGQWGVLRPIVASPVWWMAATIAGIAVSLLAMNVVFGVSVGVLGSESFAGFALAALAAGTCLGGFQWIVLRRQVPGAGWWIPASALGVLVLAVTFILCSRGADLRVVGTARLLLAAALAGTAYGLPTGAALYFLLPAKVG